MIPVATFRGWQTRSRINNPLLTGADGDLHITSGSTVTITQASPIKKWRNVLIDAGGKLTIEEGTPFALSLVQIGVSGTCVNNGTIDLSIGTFSNVAISETTLDGYFFDYYTDRADGGQGGSITMPGNEGAGGSQKQGNGGGGGSGDADSYAGGGGSGGTIDGGGGGGVVPGGNGDDGISVGSGDYQQLMASSGGGGGGGYMGHCLYLITAGPITGTGTINANGTNGGNGGNGGSATNSWTDDLDLGRTNTVGGGAGGAGAGGGAGGKAVVRYKTSNSLTMTATAGLGGSGGSGGGASGDDPYPGGNGNPGYDGAAGVIDSAAY